MELTMNVFSYFKIYYWPGVTCGWFIFTFIVSYLVSVLDGNVYPWFPYISDTGALPPESCIFGLFLNIGAMLLAITMYLRYREVSLAMNSHDINLKEVWNTAAIILGIFACFGVSLVANFQETSVGEVHFIGAILAFGIGTLYFLVQTRISFNYLTIGNGTANYGIGIKMFYVRAFLALCMIPLFFSHIICASMAMEKFTGESIVWWTEEDGGFQLRLAGSFTEWILVFFVFIYIATFTNEFKSISCKKIDIQRISNLN